MAAVQIERATKWLGDHCAVRGVDLTIHDGELMVLLGPSGCGKSTLLRMVAGLVEPSSGSVRVDGEEVHGPRRRHGTSAMMFQEAALYPHMTIRDNIGFPLKMAGVRARTIARQVEAIAASLGIADLLDRRPKTLSGGQRQRVAMARALVREPDLVLLDEPMSNLDAKLRTELRTTIALAHQRHGSTMLYVTHDQVEAMALGQRMAVMREGTIVQVGTPEEVYRRPVDAWVASFVGIPSINLFAADVVDDGSTVALTVGGAEWAVEPEVAHALAGRGGERVVVGVRPQAFRFGGEGTVVDVERMQLVGDRWDIGATVVAPHATATPDGVSIGRGHTQLVIDLEAEADVGSERWRRSYLVVDPADVHVFDAETGRALRAPAGTSDVDQRTRAVT